MEVTLYSTGCSKCQVLKKKLDAKDIKYDTISDIDSIRETGFMSVPLLKVDGKVMLFNEAIGWVNNYNNGGEE